MWPNSPHVWNNLNALLELWLLACLILGVVFLWPAPSVALGLLGSVIGLVVAMVAMRNPIGLPLPGGLHHPGVPGTPQGAALYATCGLVLFGVAGLFVTRPHATVRFLRGAAASVLIAGAFLTRYLATVLTESCPQLSDPITWSCHSKIDPLYTIDLFGSRGPNIVALFFLDAVAVALLLIVSAEQVRRTAHVPLSPSPHIGEIGFSAGDFACVLDPSNPSTWFMRLRATPGGKVDRSLLAHALLEMKDLTKKGVQPQPDGPAYFLDPMELDRVKANLRAAWSECYPDDAPGPIRV